MDCPLCHGTRTVWSATAGADVACTCVREPDDETDRTTDNRAEHLARLHAALRSTREQTA